MSSHSDSSEEHSDDFVNEENSDGSVGEVNSDGFVAENQSDEVVAEQHNEDSVAEQHNNDSVAEQNNDKSADEQHNNDSVNSQHSNESSGSSGSGGFVIVGDDLEEGFILKPLEGEAPVQKEEEKEEEEKEEEEKKQGEEKQEEPKKEEKLMKVSKSIHAVSDEFRKMLETGGRLHNLEFEKGDILYEFTLNVAIQTVAAQNGIILWEEFLKKLKNLAIVKLNVLDVEKLEINGEMFEDWSVADLREHVQNRPFLFKDYDRFYGPANSEFHQYLLVQFIARVVFSDLDERIEFNRLRKKMADEMEIFRHRGAGEIQEDLLQILKMNQKYFEIIYEDDEIYSGEGLHYIFLTEKAKEMVSLWHECAIDIIRGMNEVENVDMSRTPMVFGRIDVSENQFLIKIKALKYFHLFDPKKTYVFIDKENIKLEDKNFECFKPGRIVVCETYRVGLLSQSCSYMTKNYRLLYKKDSNYDNFPMCEYTVLDEPNGIIRLNEEGKVCEEQETKEELVLQKLKEIIDESLLIPGVISAADIVAIGEGYDYEKEEVLYFIVNQCHLYEIKEDAINFGRRKEEQVKKLEELVERLVDNSHLPSDQIDLGVSESEFNELWPIISGKFDTTFEDEKCFLRLRQKFIKGIFRD